MTHIRQAVSDFWSNRSAWEWIEWDSPDLIAEAHQLVRLAKSEPVRDWTEWEISLACAVKAGQNTVRHFEIKNWR